MKIRIGLLALIFSMAISIGQDSLAGPRVGNGGGIWLCMNSLTLEPKWMQLTDLFEASSAYGFSLQTNSQLNFKDDFIARRVRIAKSLPELDQLILKNAPSSFADLESLMVFASGNAALTVINDGLYQVHPAANSCHDGFIYFEQLADYTDDSHILINSTLWSSPALSDTNRSALLMHEIVYKALRSAFGDKNSVRARRIIGVLYAKMTDEEAASRVKSILASPAPEGEEAKIEIYRSRVACQGALLSGQRALLNRAKERLSLKLGSIFFKVQTDQGNGRPISMVIGDKTSGAVAQFDSGALNEAFLKNRKVSLKLTLAKSHTSAQLSCWEETYQ